MGLPSSRFQPNQLQLDINASTDLPQWRCQKGDQNWTLQGFFSVHRLSAFARSINTLLHAAYCLFIRAEMNSTILKGWFKRSRTVGGPIHSPWSSRAGPPGVTTFDFKGVHFLTRFLSPPNYRLQLRCSNVETHQRHTEWPRTVKDSSRSCCWSNHLQPDTNASIDLPQWRWQKVIFFPSNAS